MHPQTELSNAIRHFVKIQVYAGFSSFDEVIEDTVLEFEDGFLDPKWLESKARFFAKALFYAHELKQKDWLHTTDCDRLDAAFLELNKLNIIARHNYQCCQTCGRDAIYAEKDAHPQSEDIIGYVFYHGQDTESAVKRNYLYLAFGSYDEIEEEDEAVAEIAIAVLQKHGLQPSWVGSNRQRILINNIQWQWRRMPLIFQIS